MFITVSMTLVLSIGALSNNELMTTPAINTDFLVIADMPYTPIDTANLREDGVLGQKLKRTRHGFLMHLGDIKAGSQPCTDELLERNKQLLRNLTEQPFIYTPGDNEWTDCDRATLSPRYDELERLAFIKTLMYTQEYQQQAGKLTDYKTQKNMLENARWQFAGVEFKTLHIAGTHNGRRQILMTDRHKANEAAAQRDKLNLEWLSAANPDARGYVIGFQADIYTHGTEQPACSESVVDNCDGFKVYREAIADFAESVKKPVLVIHGDTGPYCQQSISEHLTRLNAPGDYMVSDITRVRITPNDGQLRWQISSLKTGKPLTRECR
ncbi:hypothetical protein [Pseudoalteromonas sp. SaAl2]